MKCQHCGHENRDDAKFCDECGSPLAPPVPPPSAPEDPKDPALPEESAVPAEQEKPKKKRKRKPSYVKKDGTILGEQVTEHIYLCGDGIYRWYYSVPMLKNPVILISVLKVMGLSFLIVYLMTILMGLGDMIRYPEWGVFWDLTKGFLILALVFLGITILAYLIVAACYGWEYIVLFEMDEEKVVHIVTPRQFKKAQALAWLTVLAGLAGGRLTTVGAGMLSASRSSSSSYFAAVAHVIPRRRWQVIKVNHRLNRNQVYAAPEDYDFVLNYILERVPEKARPRGMR